ncbi:MAG: heavy-metal-associated domain-containing protein [Acidobacteria bacterium]|nr:heavy-metal-associated domain-containing protein [Acidobacteriota bacterium]
MTKTSFLFSLLVITGLVIVSAACGGPEKSTPPTSVAAESAPAVETATATLTVTGMHCEGCAEAITKALSKQPGVLRAAVTYETGQGEVDYDARRIQPENLITVIVEMGYGATTTPAESAPPR